MKICVLQPSYEGTSIDYQYYDPPRNLGPLAPGHEVHHAFLKKATTFDQIDELRKQNFDVYVNLCEGYVNWDVPSIDVIEALEYFNLAYTGPTVELYDPPKDLMKMVACAQSVKAPAFALVASERHIERAIENLRFPLFVKPRAAGDSLGIDRDSLVHSIAELERKVRAVVREFNAALIEEYIAGREFTVLVAANPDDLNDPIVFKPIEFIFPEGELFKTYDLKVRQYHPECNVPCDDCELAARLKDVARSIFVGFSGVGYARCDTRVAENGEIYFLEVNFTCSVFYREGWQGSADYILAHDGIGQAGFLKHIINEAIARHKRKQSLIASPARV
ncbi:MAG TPA: hypothetical protein VNN73_08165 [Blastocatellia bacterium]|nr:hypothetical protein [Blastocatellia bacterium]